MSKSNKYVIYTVMAGRYGEVYQPKVTDVRFDYVLFSNELSGHSLGVWKIRRIPDGVARDNKRLSRYPKTHPEKLLSKYEASLYIDANLQISDNWIYDRVCELADKQIDFAGVKLVATGRDCIYRHSYDMCVAKAEHDYVAVKQMHALFELGFPEHFGLNENNIIFRSHNNLMRKVDEEWWSWIEKYSYRDQFSLMYCLWKYGVKYSFFFAEGECSANSSHIVRYEHNSNPEVSSQKWVKVSLAEAIRNKCRTLNEKQYQSYCDSWLRICKSSRPLMSLQFWGIGVFVVNFPALVALIWKKIFCR